MPKASPQRSCLGCREIRQKDELLRFVLSPDKALVPDLAGKLPGRGAYTCFRKSCLDVAVKKRQFSRAFKEEIKSPALEVLVTIVQQMQHERISSLIALANKAGKVVSGSDKVMDTLRKRGVALLIIATDISADSAAKFMAIAGATNVETVRFLTKDSLGAPLGKEIRSAAAILPGSFAVTLSRELTRYWNFFEGGA